MGKKEKTQSSIKTHTKRIIIVCTFIIVLAEICLIAGGISLIAKYNGEATQEHTMETICINLQQYSEGLEGSYAEITLSKQDMQVLEEYLQEYDGEIKEENSFYMQIYYLDYTFLLHDCTVSFIDTKNARTIEISNPLSYRQDYDSTIWE